LVLEIIVDIKVKYLNRKQLIFDYMRLQDLVGEKWF